MNHEKEDKVILEFPFWHPILHNQTSLRILKNNTKKKDLVIITSDKTAKNIGKKLWIKYSLTSNEDLIDYNYTYSEYLRYLLKNYFREFKNFFLFQKEDNLQREIKRKIQQNNGKIIFFLITLFISIALLIFVFYFAVNKTYVYIKPEMTVKTVWKNLVFRELKSDSAIPANNEILLKRIDKLIYVSQTFGTSWIDESNAKRSRGQVTLYNLFPEKVRLRPNTRISTIDWLIFTLDKSIDLPSASSDGWANIPGKKVAWVQAATHGINGKIIGSRWNIEKDTLMNLPGLTEDKDKIYAKSIADFSGGDDNFTKVLSEQDIENAKKIFEAKLKNEALNKLKEQIKLDNKNNNVNYEILLLPTQKEEYPPSTQYSDMKIHGIEDLKIGDEMENFEFKWSIKITSFTYNTKEVLNHLSSVIKWALLSEIESIHEIDEKSLRIAYVIKGNAAPYSIKATAQVEAIYLHNFLSSTNNYVEKLKFTIAGLKKDIAHNILLNNPKISDVKIETRPFFMENISSLPKNIHFKVIEY